ncbi:MAG: hypothetical protein LQ342_004241 [Letrouitia transgressa]|nr:MAG: hypothetical protein LQ342_004241 [Letrouitia transgressa]
MYLGSRLWTSVSYILNLATLSPLENPGAGDQAPQVTLPDQWQNEPLLTPANIPSVPQDDAPGFIPFTPPGGATTGPYADFKCDYPNLGADWHACSTPTDRACWLKNDKLKQKYDINTNYEDTSVNSTPPGVSRYYELYLHDGWVNADGLNFTSVDPGLLG